MHQGLRNLRRHHLQLLMFAENLRLPSKDSCSMLQMMVLRPLCVLASLQILLGLENKKRGTGSSAHCKALHTFQMADSFERHKTCTCAKLYALLCNYFAPEPPRLSRIVRASGLGEKPVLKIMDKLRAAEAALARKQCEEMRMSGRLEVDATKIRIAYVSKSNEFWQEHVAAWKASHPHARLPSYLISALD